MPLPKDDFSEYQRLRRAAKYPCMGCGEIGAATERYRATAAAAVIRCCKPCHKKITAALQAATPTPKPIEPPVNQDHFGPVSDLPDTYEARQAIADNAEYGITHPARMALGREIHLRQLELIGGGLTPDVAKAQAYKDILGRESPRVRIARLS